ncbi:MAG: peptide-methionine (S)-S-oxide reductase [Aquaticitalea sp.]
MTQKKIAFGGGCHWCTEAVFQSIKGVNKVEQGYVASVGEHNSFSEAVIVHYNMKSVNLKTLIEIHLLTHNSSSEHSMRYKYRSAIYSFSDMQREESKEMLNGLQNEYDRIIITKVYPFSEFKPSRDAIQDYYQKNPEKPFCKTFINPKLKLLIQRFAKFVNHETVDHLQIVN